MNGTMRYVMGRVGWAMLLVFGVCTAAFVVTRLLPGDPARMLVGPQASAGDVSRARQIYGLDEPALAQYGRFWTRLVHRGAASTASDPVHQSCLPLLPGLHLDLGYSFHYRKPVARLMADKIPRSIELAAAALFIQLMIGVSVGVLAAARRGTGWDEAAIGATLVGISAPTFLLGLFLQYLFAYKLRALPYDGYGSAPAEHLSSLVLPSLTLGIFGAALYARLVRDELGELLTKDFVRTARAKGASNARAIVVHALRNAVVPLATLAALDLGTMVGGAIVTERLFRWPGMGQMAVEALLNRDGPVILGTVLFASTAVVLTTLLLDLSYVLLDPRLRRSR
jgi:peptide/nickel transport system permease protein